MSSIALPPKLQYNGNIEMNTAKPEQSRILLLDDEEMVRNLLSRALKADGHLVLKASTKKEALALLNEDGQVFHLLIVDKNLPDGSGLELIEAARNLGYDGEAIVITGYSDTDSAIRSIALRVFRYVRKPFDLDALKVDIRRALETGRLKTDLAKRTNELELTNADLRSALTQVKEAELRRIQAERLATIGYLAAGVAHEINNPLSLLSMTMPYALHELETLLKDEVIRSDPERANTSIRRMLKSLHPTQEAVELLMGLAADLHSLGRKESKEPQQIKIADAINSALRIVRHQIKHKAQITLDLADDLTITGQLNRLIQVFINILTNAGKSIDDGAPEDNKIAIRSYLDGSQVIVEISDTGCGIPKENLDNIFDKFFTYTPAGKKEGTGIGLSIVKELVEEHSGTLNVVSQMGIGTSFYVKIPSASVRKSYPPLSAVSRPGAAEFVRARRTILFVDNDVNNLKTYEESFGQMHNVMVASDNEEAIAIIEEHSDTIDVIVCEIANQENSYTELFRITTDNLPDLRHNFIFIGQDGPSSAAARKAGHSVFHRPVRPAVLLAAIYKIRPRRPSSD